jgi:hypothetical protein
MEGIPLRPARPCELRIDAFGVGLEIGIDDPALLEAVYPILPPGWRETSRPARVRFELAAAGDARWHVVLDGTPVAQAVEADAAVAVLDSRIRAVVASLAPGRVFVHAGVVGVDGHAIVVPGDSLSGKTTLVNALIRAGATYYSDEYAVLDAMGQVHPYPKPLSIRIGGPPARTREVAASELGAATAAQPALIRLIALTTYKPQARWQPQTGTPAAAALALFSHAVLARSEPERVLGAVASAAAQARLVQSDRGEAEPTAHALLDALALLV